MTEIRNRTDKILNEQMPPVPAAAAASQQSGDFVMESRKGRKLAPAPVSPKQSRNLSLLLRLYIFALHGYFIEVNFTAIWNFIETRDFKMTGNSSLWSLLIYGTCGLVLEEMTYYFRRKEFSIMIRALSYLLVCYIWEFSSGLILRHFNACPWDYSEFKYNFQGLITLEYAPFWLLSGLVCERVIIGQFQHLRWIACPKSI